MLSFRSLLWPFCVHIPRVALHHEQKYQLFFSCHLFFCCSIATSPRRRTGQKLAIHISIGLKWENSYDDTVIPMMTRDAGAIFHYPLEGALDLSRGSKTWLTCGLFGSITISHLFNVGKDLKKQERVLLHSLWMPLSLENKRVSQ